MTLQRTSSPMILFGIDSTWKTVYYTTTMPCIFLSIFSVQILKHFYVLSQFCKCGQWEMWKWDELNLLAWSHAFSWWLPSWNGNKSTRQEVGILSIASVNSDRYFNDPSVMSWQSMEKNKQTNVGACYMFLSAQKKNTHVHTTMYLQHSHYK